MSTDPFANVFGPARAGLSAVNDQLDAQTPTEAARRKLDDAARGLGSGIVAGAIKSLHANAAALDRPLLTELAQRTCLALAAGAVARRRDAYAAVCDLVGAHAELSDVCIVNETENADGNKGFCMHILPGGADADPFALTGQTICGKDASKGYIRLHRGIWHAARTGRGIGQVVGSAVQLLQWCRACQAHESEHSDCAETADGYPLFGADGQAHLQTQFAEQLADGLPGRLQADSFDQDAAFAWADGLADDVFVTVASRRALARGALAVRYALKDAPARRLETMVSEDHATTLSDVLPDAQQWTQLTVQALAAVTGRDHELAQATVDQLARIPAEKAAARSGKPLPDTALAVGARAGAPAVTAAEPAPESDKDRRAKVTRNLGRI